MRQPVEKSRDTPYLLGDLRTTLLCCRYISPNDPLSLHVPRNVRFVWMFPYGLQKPRAGTLQDTSTSK